MANDMRPITQFMHMDAGGDNAQAAMLLCEALQQTFHGTVFKLTIETFATVLQWLQTIQHQYTALPAQQLCKVFLVCSPTFPHS